MKSREFGTRLRELRKRAGLSQRELANRIGVNYTYLSKIESGAMPPPSEKVVLQLAEELNADKDELMTLAGKIPADIAQILRSREALQLLRSERLQKKAKQRTKASTNRRGAIPMNIKSFARVAIAVTLVVAIGAAMWFSSPIPSRAFTIAAPVADSPVSGNSTYLLGEKVTIAAGMEFDALEYKDFQSISVNITGPETFTKLLPIDAGTYNYTDVPGSLDVVVTWDTGIAQSGYNYGYSGGTGTGNITYSIQWTPPYTLTSPPTPPPAALPANPDFHFDIGGASGIAIPYQVEQQISASLDFPQGLAYDSTNQLLYILVPANYDDGTDYKDVIIITDTSGTYDSWMVAPGNNWTTEGIAFVGTTLYAAYNEWDATAYTIRGKIAKYSSGTWTDIAGLSNLNEIGGLASDGTNLFIAYRNQLTIDKRDPASGAQITTFDLAAAWDSGGMGYGPPIWGLDALAYSSGELYAAQGDTVVAIDTSTTPWEKTDDYPTGLWDIRGLSFVSETYSGTAYDILYLGTTQWPGQVYRASKPGVGAAEVENTPIGDYTTEFRVIANGTPLTDASSFTLTKLTTDPVVTITAPTEGFSVTAGSEDITVSGTINDPSITSVTVGIALPEVTAFEDDVETESTTLANWQHSAVTGESMWMMYSSDDFWHRSDERDHTGGTSWSWRYANESTGNYESSQPWTANAGALQTQNTIAIGADNVLTFWTWYDGELDFWPDRKLVEASTDGTHWQPLAWVSKFWPPFQPPDISTAQFDSLVSVPERTWTKVEVDLSSYASQSIYIRFRFDTMDDWSNNFEGWYIDDITITGAGFLGTAVSVDENLAFSTVFTLAEGSNVISVTATRTNYLPTGTGTASVTGSLDTSNPVITLDPVTTPTNQTYQVISGTVTESNFERLELRKNGVLKWSTSVLGTGNTFSQSIALSEGTNAILITVTDKAGLSGNVTTSISLDSTGPVFQDVFSSRYDVAYKTGEVSARPLDEFFIALKVTDAASTVASVRLRIPGGQGWSNAIAKSELPEAVIDSWGITASTKTAMNYIIPMQLPSGTPAGTYSWTVVATDAAGNSSNLTVQTSVVTTLQAFNIYLMPDWNLVSTPVIPTTDNITTLTSSVNATGLFELVWYYDASDTTDPWKLYQPDAPSDLTTMETGKGYWFKMKNLAAFTAAGKVSGPMATGLPDTPAPVKLTISGVVLQPGAVVPPSYTVYAGWNLIGFHSELARPVSTALGSVTVPQQKWGSLLQYLNYISFPFGEGQEGAMPEIDLGRFDRLISTDTMYPGRGFWVYMVEAGTIVP